MYDPSALYIDPILTNLSVGFQDQALFGEEIMPETPVRTPSGRYNVFDRSDWLIYESRREPGAVAHEIKGRKWSTDVFDTIEHALQVPVHDEERRNLTSQGGIADPVFGGALQIDLDADATRLVTRSLQLERELKISNLVRNTANYPGGNTVTLSSAAHTTWDDITYGTPGVATTVTSDPVAVIMQGMRTIWMLTGRYPNTLVIPTQGLPYIENHPRIVDRFKTFSLTMPDAFRALTGFEGRIITVQSLYNAANNIDATQNITSFWGKDVWLGIVDKQPGLNTLTFGKTFAQIYPDGTTKPTERWREEGRKSDLIRTNYKYDLKIVSSVAGYLIKQAFGASAF